MLQQIFTNKAGDGTSLTVDHGGGLVEVVVAGNFGGGTATLQARYKGTATWVPISGGAWTEPEVRTLHTVRPCELRLELAGASAADLNAWI